MVDKDDVAFLTAGPKRKDHKSGKLHAAKTSAKVKDAKSSAHTRIFEAANMLPSKEQRAGAIEKAKEKADQAKETAKKALSAASSRFAALSFGKPKKPNEDPADEGYYANMM
jgi:hypothetical protein